jgi:hypothetical protein
MLADKRAKWEEITSAYAVEQRRRINFIFTDAQTNECKSAWLLTSQL